MKTVAIIFLSVIGVFVTCGHEALIELTPGAKKRQFPRLASRLNGCLITNTIGRNWNPLGNHFVSKRLKERLWNGKILSL